MNTLKSRTLQKEICKPVTMLLGIDQGLYGFDDKPILDLNVKLRVMV